LKKSSENYSAIFTFFSWDFFMSSAARIQQTLQKLLMRRGYTVPSPLPPMQHFTVTKELDGSVLLVYKAEEDARVGVVVIREMVKLMENFGANDALLLARGGTSSATAAINALMMDQKFITIIPPTSLIYDIFEHNDVPLHRLLSPPELSQLLKERKLKLSQFPSMRMDDPMCRYLGGKPGDVFEITRNRPTVGKHLYYRKVVTGSAE
jgi:DNA-directed RNA polymerase subunit H (RpoH/RPB5)